MSSTVPKLHKSQHNQQFHRRVFGKLLNDKGYSRQNLMELTLHEKSGTCTIYKYGRGLQKWNCASRTSGDRIVSSLDKSMLLRPKRRLIFWRLGVNYSIMTDSIHTIILLFAVIMTVVISENTVLASQRDSVKQKNSNNLSSNLPTGSVTDTNSNFDSINEGNTIRSKDNASSGNPSINVSLAAADIRNKASYATLSPISSSTTLVTVGISTTVSNSLYNGSVQKNTTTYYSGPSIVNRNVIEVTEDTRNGPYFDKAASKNITALLGKTAYLNCRVKNLGNKTMLLQVSWVRHRDIHLLTVGRYTYTSDQRFRAIHQPQTEDWILQIKYPQHRDSGIYECQVSTTPHMSHYIHLNVVEPSTEIIGAPDLYIESGSTINLTCVILNSPEPPAYIFWNHNNAIINYDSPRGGVSVVTNKGETTTSFLLIKSARPSDSGHYQCNPSNAKPKSVTVHVLNGVSHSVSRGVPSSNAARGTSISSNVPKSLSPSVHVNVLMYLSICQVVYANIGSSWDQDGRHLKQLVVWVLNLLVLLATEVLGKQVKRRKFGMIRNCGCYFTDIQLKRNVQLQQSISDNNSDNGEVTLRNLVYKTTIFNSMKHFNDVQIMFDRLIFEPDIR
uniref:Neurotrimin n=1 Tax=Zeugodacus cucurbitae TaxID=28588 RepID=A0A0A1XME0_ZEUCU